MTDIESTETAVIQLGLLFQRGREKRNLAVSDVAAELKVLSSAVKGIESGDYSAIKGSVFVKGYIKAYAKFLQLDIDECLALYAESLSAVEDSTSTALIANTPVNPKLIKIVVIVVVACVFMGVMYLLLSGDSDDKITPAATQAQVKKDSTIEPESEPSSVAEPSALIFDDIPVTASVLLPADAGQDDMLATVPSAQKHTLSLVFTADCWVEVNDSNGKKLVSDLKRAGEQLDLNGSPPYEVLLGYGPAVAVSYQGAPVTFDVGRNPTVKLSIGDKQ